MDIIDHPEMVEWCDVPLHIQDGFNQAESKGEVITPSSVESVVVLPTVLRLRELNQEVAELSHEASFCIDPALEKYKIKGYKEASENQRACQRVVDLLRRQDTAMDGVKENEFYLRWGDNNLYVNGKDFSIFSHGKLVPCNDPMGIIQALTTIYVFEKELNDGQGTFAHMCDELEEIVSLYPSREEAIRRKFDGFAKEVRLASQDKDQA